MVDVGACAVCVGVLVCVRVWVCGCLCLPVYPSVRELFVWWYRLFLCDILGVRFACLLCCRSFATATVVRLDRFGYVHVYVSLLSLSSVSLGLSVLRLTD